MSAKVTREINFYFTYPIDVNVTVHTFKLKMAVKYEIVIQFAVNLYPVYTCTFNPERNRFRSHASVYTTPTNPDQRFDPD